MDIVVKGRNVEVPDHYRAHVTDKLQKFERYDHKLIRIDVELFHERNPRQAGQCQRVEITCASRGPVVRAEACAPDFYSALDVAVAKLSARLRRAADRRRVHRGRHAPVSVAAATASLPPASTAFQRPAVLATPGSLDGGPPDESNQEWDVDDRPWRIVRMKEHRTEPMTVQEALFQMELVGHDFYLYLDKESGQPSVVYRRRKGYDYGVISLVA